jgi:hypothetical protein
MAAKCTNIYMYLLLLLHPYITKTCFAFFDCVQLTTNGRYILRGDENLFCYESTWNYYLVLIVFQLIFYLIGIVLFFYKVTMFVREKYPSDELYQAGAALDSFYRYTGFLCRKYHPIAYLYELVIIARTASITIVSTLSHMSGGEYHESYLFLFAAVHFTFGVIHLLRQPLRTRELNFLDAVLTLGVQLGVCMLSLFFVLL